MASNVLAHGTGALNVDGCRVGAGLFVPGGGNLPSGGIMGRKNSGKPSTAGHTSGRWPANVILDESQAAALDEQSGASESRIGKPRAIRAAGLANGQNPISIVVPCHRVIGSNGTLTGYGGGLPRKKWLLEHEGAL